MTRALGLCGFTGGFLIISGSLRQTLLDATTSGWAVVHQYSPYSYVGLAFVAFGGVALTLISGSRAR